jgi:hypothetical protein
VSSPQFEGKSQFDEKWLQDLLKNASFIWGINLDSIGGLFTNLSTDWASQEDDPIRVSSPQFEGKSQFLATMTRKHQNEVVPPGNKVRPRRHALIADVVMDGTGFETIWTLVDVYKKKSGDDWTAYTKSRGHLRKPWSQCEPGYGNSPSVSHSEGEPPTPEVGNYLKPMKQMRLKDKSNGKLFNQLL